MCAIIADAAFDCFNYPRVVLRKRGVNFVYRRGFTEANPREYWSAIGPV